MGSKRHQIYLPEHLADIVDATGEGDSLSGRIAAILDRYQWLVRGAEMPAWSKDQWLLVLDACNGWASWAEAGETLMVGIAAEVADHISLNDAAEKWRLSPEQAQTVVQDIAAMTDTQRIGLVERIERFWRRCDLDTDEALAASWIGSVYRIEGHCIERLIPPRLRAVMKRDPDGGWSSSDVDPIDELPADATQLARIMRQVGDAWSEHLRMQT